MKISIQLFVMLCYSATRQSRRKRSFFFPTPARTLVQRRGFSPEFRAFRIKPWMPKHAPKRRIALLTAVLLMS